MWYNGFDGVTAKRQRSNRFDLLLGPSLFR